MDGLEQKLKAISIYRENRNHKKFGGTQGNQPSKKNSGAQEFQKQGDRGSCGNWSESRKYHRGHTC